MLPTTNALPRSSMANAVATSDPGVPNRRVHISSGRTWATKSASWNWSVIRQEASSRRVSRPAAGYPGDALVGRTRHVRDEFEALTSREHGGLGLDPHAHGAIAVSGCGTGGQQRNRSEDDQAGGPANRAACPRQPPRRASGTTAPASSKYLTEPGCSVTPGNATASVRSAMVAVVISARSAISP